MFVIPHQAHAHQFIESSASPQGIINDFRQEHAVDEGEIGSLCIAVHAVIVHDKVVPLPDHGSISVQSVQGTTAGDIGQLKEVVLVVPDIYLPEGQHSHFVIHSDGFLGQFQHKRIFRHKGLFSVDFWFPRFSSCL